MRLARLVVGGSAVAGALFQAWLLQATGRSWLLPLLGLGLGLGLRLVRGTTAVVALTLAVASVWPVLGGALAPGAPPLEPIWPWLTFLIAGLAWPTAEDWHSRGAWRAAIAAWTLVVAVTWPIVAARELDFTRETLTAITVNGASAGTPPATASFVALLSVTQIVALLLVDWYVGQCEDDRRRLWWMLLPGVLVTAAVTLWQQLVDPTLLGSQPWVALHRGAGTFYDANATGAFLALAGPALAANLAAAPGAGRRFVPWLGWGVALVCLGGVLATGSRTALSALILSVVVQVAVRGRLVAWLGLATVIAAVTVLAANPPDELGQGQAAGRLAGSIGQALGKGPAGVWALLRDRDGYGIAARAMIADHPWFGVGTGVFPVNVGNYGLTQWGSPLPADNAQNWWRHQAAELGLFGAIPAFAASLLLVFTTGRALVRRSAAAVAAPLVGFGLMALVSPPTAYPILQVVLGMIVGAVLSADRAPIVSPLPRWTAAVVWAFAAVCATGTAVTGWRDLRPPYRAADLHFAYNYGAGEIEPTPFGRGRWMSTRAIAVVAPGVAKTVVTEIIAPHDDLDAHPVGIRVADRDRVICEARVTDHTPFVCRVPVTSGVWPMIQIDIERPWQVEPGHTRAGVVTARYE